MLRFTQHRPDDKLPAEEILNLHYIEELPNESSHFMAMKGTRFTTFKSRDISFDPNVALVQADARLESGLIPNIDGVLGLGWLNYLYSRFIPKCCAASASHLSHASGLDFILHPEEQF